MNPVTNPLLLVTISIITFVTACTLALELQLINGSSIGCNHTERAALLSFKKGITRDTTNRLTSWHGEDCCLWRGISCSNKTGHIIQLDLRCPSIGTLGWQDDNTLTEITDGCQSSNALWGMIAPLLSLSYLEHLDLSMNCLLDSTGNIPEFMGSMTNLRYLNLSGIPFIGEVPPQLGKLSKLQYLDLGTKTQAFGDTDRFLYSTDITWLTNQKLLQYLSMSSVNLSGVADWPNVLNRIPSLRVVDLSYCSLHSANQLLPDINMTKLEKLDLSFNTFNHTIAACWFWKATSLKYLSLQGTILFGELHDALENMSALQVLDLKYKNNNNLVINGNFKNLCNLKILDLSSTGMYGDITVLFERLPPCGRNRLQELHLTYNNFTGTLPNSIGNFTSLITFDLSANKITGSIPSGLWNCTCLKSLDLSSNNIIGPLTAEIRHLSHLINLDLSNNLLSGFVPTEIGAFTNLTSLQLSNNNFTGIITEAHFAGLTSLKKLDLSLNNFKIVLDTNWLPPFRLKSALFASCQMGPLFPAWLQWQPGIIKLDISSNDLMGEIPNWFWPTFSDTTYIDISNNKLSGILPAHWGEMAFAMVNLSSNQLTGPIPKFPRNITILDMSSNLFSGTLPSFEAPRLEVLIMYSNQIGGRIPESFCTMQILMDLDLSSNVLEGEIPHCFGTEIQLLDFLLLSNNNFSGQFPSFLQNCTHLIFLDLAWNNFYGTIPSWIGELTDLQFLRLSHNTFSGNIPNEITNLSHLQYLDLSSNNLSGFIPCHLENLTGMTLKDSRPLSSYRFHFLAGEENQVGDVTIVGQFGELLSIITKGHQLRYGSPLAYFIGIDLSENYLIGEIPIRITSLDALISLNLSSNQLSGKMPNKIGALQSLESLDLSENKLSGEIPPSLSNLTSLSYLNLSYNSLSGRIPSGRQLDTLNPDNPSCMYIGNSALCGPPLLINCSGNGLSAHDHPKTNGNVDGLMPLYLGLVLGLVVGKGVVFCALFLNKTWRIAYFRLFDKLYDRSYVFVVLKWASLTRKEVTE